MQAGLETFNQQLCSPESCHSVTLARKLRHFSQKRSLQQSHFRGRKHIGFLDSKKWSSPVQHVDVCVILPAFLWFHGFWRTFEAAGCVPSVTSQPQKQDCHTLQQVDLARPFLVSPAIKIEIENSLEIALSKAKRGSAWQSHFWQCRTLRPARRRSSLHYANKSKLGFV